MTTNMPSGISTRGVVDLSSLGDAAQPAADGSQPTTPGDAAPGLTSAGTSVVEVTQANAQHVLMDRSASVVVVLVVWSSADLSSKSLITTMTSLCEQAQGAWQLATLDVQTQPQLGAAFGVQAVPVTLGVVNGQMVPLFSGVLGESSVRPYLTQLMQLAASQSGHQPPTGQSDQEPPVDQPQQEPEIQKAFEALEQGDFDTAQAQYEQLLAQEPGHELARIGLGQVDLIRRVSALNPAQVLSEATQRPHDLQVALNAADVQLTQGQVEQAFSRLLGFIAVTTGDQREQVRIRLVSYFDLLGPGDPRVNTARQRLTNALF